MSRIDMPFTSEGPASTAAGVAAVGRALTVLGAFRDGDASLPLRVLAARTGLYKSTILRLLASLERGRCVVRMPDGSWALGPMLFHWGALYGRAQGMEASLMPSLTSLAEALGENATFWVRVDEERRLCLHRVAARPNGRGMLQPGDVLPMGGGATGKVFAAHAEPALPVPGAAIEAVATPGTHDGDACAVAAPVFGPRRLLRGVITVAGPQDRLWPQAERARALVRDAAMAATRSLGG